MAGKIQLTPQELLAQSQEMLSLQGDYEELFRQSETLLNRVNENWSAALANNFSGKLLSAQKSFKQISAMLGSGGNLAAESARTYESVDSLLAKNMNGGGASGLAGSSVGAAVAAGLAGAAAVTAASGHSGSGVAEDAASVTMGMRKTELSWESFRDYVVEDTKRSWNIAGETLQEVSDWYENMPEKKRFILDSLIDKYIPSQMKSTYQLTEDIVTNDVSWDTGKKAAKAVLGGTRYGIIKDAFEYMLDEEVQKKYAYYENRNIEELRKGNVLACLTNMAGSVVDEMGGGVVRGLGALAGREISKLPGMSFLEEQFGFDAEKSIKSAIDKGHKAVSEEIKKGVDAVGRAEEKAREVISDAAEFVGDGAKKVFSSAGKGLKKVGDGIKGFLKWG